MAATVTPDANTKTPSHVFGVHATRDRAAFDPHWMVAAAISPTHVLTASITNTFSHCLLWTAPPLPPSPTHTRLTPANSIAFALSPFPPLLTPPLTQSTASSLNMSVVSLLGVEVKNNPARFDEPYEFEITFECLEQLQKGECTRPACPLSLLTRIHRP